jgi:hypothetical protein
MWLHATILPTKFPGREGFTTQHETSATPATRGQAAALRFFAELACRYIGVAALAPEKVVAT